jgi:hypothetical protein
LQYNYATSVAFAQTDIGMGSECQFFKLQKDREFIFFATTRIGRLTPRLTKMRARLLGTASEPSTRKDKLECSFMAGVPENGTESDQPRSGQLQKKVQKMCKWEMGAFSTCPWVLRTSTFCTSTSNSKYKGG